jgi:hypothetical protein
LDVGDARRFGRVERSVGVQGRRGTAAEGRCEIVGSPRRLVLALLHESNGHQGHAQGELWSVTGCENPSDPRFVRLFAARYSDRINDPADRIEVAGVRWVSVSALFTAIAAGNVTDGFTLAAVACGVAQRML